MDKSRYILNALSNQGSFLVGVLMALFLSPLVVSSLGDEMYGLWTLIVSVTGYYNFIDLGIRSAVGQYVTRYMAAGDKERLDRTLGTSFLVLSLVAVLVLLITLAVAAWFPHFFKLNSGHWSDVRIAILLAGAAMALKFPAGVFQSVVIGCNRWDVLSLRVIASRLTHGVAVFCSLKAGWGILGVAVATVTAQVLELLLMWRAARSLAPTARFAFSYDRESFAEIRSYGVFAFVIAICEQVILYMDTFIIGYFLGPVAVTFYTIGANLVPYMDGLAQSVGSQVRPLAIAADAGNRGEELKILLIRGSRYVTAFVCIVFAGIWSCGPDFLGAWMGEKYLSGSPYPSSGDILLLLALAHFCFNSSTVSRQILFGQRKNNVLALVAVLEALVNLGLKLLLIGPYGNLGVAVGTLIPMFLFSGIVIPTVTARQTGARVRDYWMHSALPNWALVAISCALGTEFRNLVPLEGWPRVLATGAFVGSLHSAIVWWIIVHPSIRAAALAKARTLLGRAPTGAA